MSKNPAPEEIVKLKVLTDGRGICTHVVFADDENKQIGDITDVEMHISASDVTRAKITLVGIPIEIRKGKYIVKRQFEIEEKCYRNINATHRKRKVKKAK